MTNTLSAYSFKSLYSTCWRLERDCVKKSKFFLQEGSTRTFSQLCSPPSTLIIFSLLSFSGVVVTTLTFFLAQPKLTKITRLEYHLLSQVPFNIFSGFFFLLSKSMTARQQVIIAVKYKTRTGKVYL